MEENEACECLGFCSSSSEKVSYRGCLIVGKSSFPKNAAFRRISAKGYFCLARIFKKNCACYDLDRLYNFENKMADEAKRDIFVFCSLFWFLDDYILSLEACFLEIIF